MLGSRLEAPGPGWCVMVATGGAPGLSSSSVRVLPLPRQREGHESSARDVRPEEMSALPSTTTFSC